MRHVLWIGGPPGAGKTSVATRIARRHGLRLYSADTRTWDHRDRALAAGSEAARRFEDLSPVDRWEESTDELVAMSLHVERTSMVLDDVRALPRSSLVIAEGTPIRTTILTSGAAVPSHSLWLLPTAEFQKRQLASRGTSEGQARLYTRLGDLIAGEATAIGAPIEVVDETRSLDDIVDVVEARFGEFIDAGPRAESETERSALLGEMNQAIVDQVRGFHARPWAEGDAGEVVREFVCECGDPTCDAIVTITVGEAAAGLSAPAATCARSAGSPRGDRGTRSGRSRPV